MSREEKIEHLLRLQKLHKQAVAHLRTPPQLRIPT
jgi:hypothetical protein